MTKKETDKNEIEVLEFEGSKIKIGKKEFIMPPLPITYLHKAKFYELQKELGSIGADDEKLDIIGDLTYKTLEFVYQALKMNYPKITREESVDRLTLRDLRKILPALLDIQDGIPKNA